MGVGVNGLNWFFISISAKEATWATKPRITFIHHLYYNVTYYSPTPHSSVPEHQDVDGAVGAGRLHRHDEAAARGPPAGQGSILLVDLFIPV